MRFYERLTQAVLRRPVELGQYLSIQGERDQGQRPRLTR